MILNKVIFLFLKQLLDNHHHNNNIHHYHNANLDANAKKMSINQEKEKETKSCQKSFEQLEKEKAISKWKTSKVRSYF